MAQTGSSGGTRDETKAVSSHHISLEHKSGLPIRLWDIPREEEGGGRTLNNENDSSLDASNSGFQEVPRDSHIPIRAKRLGSSNIIGNFYSEITTSLVGCVRQSSAR